MFGGGNEVGWDGMVWDGEWEREGRSRGDEAKKHVKKACICRASKAFDHVGLPLLVRGRREIGITPAWIMSSSR